MQFTDQVQREFVCENQNLHVHASLYDSETLVIGISHLFGNGQVFTNVTLAVDAAFSMLPETAAKGVKNIEFVLLSGVRNVLNQAEWRQGHPASTNETSDYMQYLTLPENKEAMDVAWAESKIGYDVFPGMLPFCVNGDGAHVPRKDIVEHYSVPADVAEYFRNKMEETFGAGNVFVSNQVIPLLSAQKFWDDFAEQARAALVDKSRFCRHIYDTQVHPRGKMFLPAYAIPAAVLKAWPRRFSRVEYDAVFSAMDKPIDEWMEMCHQFQKITPGAHVGVSRLCSMKETTDFIQSLTQDAYYIAEREGYFLPGQPDSLYRKIKRYFAWKKRLAQDKAAMRASVKK